MDFEPIGWIVNPLTFTCIYSYPIFLKKKKGRDVVIVQYGKCSAADYEISLSVEFKYTYSVRSHHTMEDTRTLSQHSE